MRQPDWPEWWDRPIIVPANDREREAVKQAQRVMRCDETGVIDFNTRSHIQGFQGLFRLRITGILDLDTAKKLEQVRTFHAQ